MFQVTILMNNFFLQIASFHQELWERTFKMWREGELVKETMLYFSLTVKAINKVVQIWVVM